MSARHNGTTIAYWYCSLFKVMSVILLISFLLSSCSDVPVPGNVPSQDVDDADNANDSDAEPGGENTIDELVAYPADVDEDDREGLIVTGLGGLPGADVVSPWLAVTRTFRSVSTPEQSGDGEVLLSRYDDDFPVSAHLTYLDLPLDSCVVRPLNPVDGEEGDGNPPPASISGGQTVVLNSPSGPWFSLTAERLVDGQIVYRTKGLLPGALPDEGSLSIPGAAFPTVAAYPLHEPQAIERRQPDRAQAINADSPLQWVPGQGNTRVKIDWLAFDSSDVFQGFPLSCLVRDDGEFVPGEVARSAIAGSTHRLTVRYSRLYARLDVLNGVVFYQEAEIAE